MEQKQHSPLSVLWCSLIENWQALFCKRKNKGDLAFITKQCPTVMLAPASEMN